MSLVVSASRVLARLHYWFFTAWILSRVPLTALDNNSVGRLTYALMMLHRTYPERSHRLLSRIVRHNINTTPELRIELANMATAINDAALASSLLQQAVKEAENPHMCEAAQQLLRVNRGLSDGTFQSMISARVDALPFMSRGGLVTLVPLSSHYLDLWQLWFKQVRKHVGGPVIVMAMDDAALAAAEHKAGVFSFDLREFFAWSAEGALHPRSRGVLWLLRVLVLHEMVLRGHATLVLDLDAIAISDIAPMLASLPEADVIAQKDHSLPMDVNRQLGFVLCCGFMLWRPTPAAAALLGRFAVETAIERDDQMALNHILARDGITGRTENKTCMSFRSAGVQFVCPASSLVSRTLYHGMVVRHFQQEGETVAEVREALKLETLC